MDTANHRNRLPVSRVTRTKSQARSTYNRLSRWYDLLAGGFEGKFRDAGLGRLAPGPGQIVLEIGFGTGHSIVAERPSQIYERASGDEPGESCPEG